MEPLHPYTYGRYPVDKRNSTSNICGNNYFKLRDLGKAFDFGVGWDNTSKTITIILLQATQ